MDKHRNIVNYAQLVKHILDTTIENPNVNTAFEGDIYEINSLEENRYPVFVVASTQQHTEYENFFRYNLTLYYISRQLPEDDQRQNPDKLIIHSNGIDVLSQVINELRHNDDILNVSDSINYTLWDTAHVFSDICCGVYAQVSIDLPKITLC